MCAVPSKKNSGAVAVAVCVAVRCLVEHFFPDELRSAIELKVYHCSGGAPLHDGDAHEVPEEIMSVLDESNYYWVVLTTGSRPQEHLSTIVLLLLTARF